MASGRLLAYFMLGAAVSALAAIDDEGDACGLDSGCDEVGLIQQRPLVPKAQFECLNGGRLHVLGVCICDAGWSGPRCEVPEEYQKYEPVATVGGPQIGTTTCNLTFRVFPYGFESLWGTAYQGWEGCAGRRQSPIDIVTAYTKKVPYNGKLNTNYGLPSGAIAVSNNGHSLQVGGNFGSFVLDGTTYTSQGFHFHIRSEHRVNGEQAALEMHIVNTAGSGGGVTGAIAVVGILFDIGDENKCLAEVFRKPPIAGCMKRIQPIDLGKCFAKQLAGPWWSYAGSLTTPPCSEGVLWNVMTNRATISHQQLKEIQTRYTNDARTVQPLNGRQVSYHFVK